MNKSTRLALEELEARCCPTAVCAANPVYEAECTYFDNLIQPSTVTVSAVKSGNWSDPSTWSTGALPTAGATVWIPEGDTVTVDGDFSGTPLRGILDNGLLTFATDVNTGLLVDTIAVGTDVDGVPTGELDIGTLANPIQSNVTATITFWNSGPIRNPGVGLSGPTLFPDDWQQESRGLISMGTVSIVGSEVTPYEAAVGNLAAGSTTITLAAAPTRWKVGDTLLIPGTTVETGTDRNTQNTPYFNQDEQITIEAIEGNQVTLAAPLQYTHTPAAGTSEEISNESRNIVFQSQDAADPSSYGHIMFMHNDDATIEYADFLNLGRTNKADPTNNAKLIPTPSTTVDQTADPLGTINASTSFQALGTVTVGSDGTFNVQLTNNANGSVAADAIALQSTSNPASAPIILDTNSPGYSETGAWTTIRSGYSGNERVAKVNTGTSTANWDFTGLTPGTYIISASWAATNTSYATNATYTATDGSGNSLTISPDGVPNVGTVAEGTGTNEISRYALHFHQGFWPSINGTEPPAQVVGCFEMGSPGWGYVNHSSNVDFVNNVAYNNFGAGFVTQAGNEQGSFTGDLAVKTIGVPNGATTEASRSNISDFGFGGEGFWMQSPIAINDCIATEAQVGFAYYAGGASEPGLGNIKFFTISTSNPPAYGYRATSPDSTVNTATVPIPSFDNNVVSFATIGAQFNHVNDQGLPAGMSGSVVSNFTANSVNNGIYDNYSNDITVKNSSLSLGTAPVLHDYYNDPVKSYGMYILSAYGRNINLENTNVAGFDTGYSTSSFSGNVAGGTWNNLTNFAIPIPSGIGRTIRFSDINFVGGATYSLAQINFAQGQGTLAYAQVAPEQIVLPDGNQLYSTQQAADFVPWPTALSGLPNALVGLTNAQLLAQYGMVPYGEIAPPDATLLPGSTTTLEGSAQPLPESYSLFSLKRVSDPTYTLKYQAFSDSHIVTYPTPFTLEPGYNLITAIINGTPHSWIVEYVLPK